VNNANIETKLEIWRRRAKALAASQDIGQGEEPLDTVIILEIASERVGVSLSAFEEIAPLTRVAELPGTPKWLAGVAQVRGRIVPVLDLQNWLNLSGVSRPRYLAVMRAGVDVMATLVDAVNDVRELHRHEIADAIAADPTRGHRATTTDLVVLLDVEVLLKHPDMIVDEEVKEE
jgi:purine-binding chemotaxis protein CheW